MKRFFYCVIGASALFYPMVASAGEVTHREAIQEQRIYQGVRNGGITPQEYRNLQRREASVALQRYRDTHDGNGLQPGERESLNDRLDRISHSIYSDKH